MKLLKLIFYILLLLSSCRSEQCPNILDVIMPANKQYESENKVFTTWTYPDALLIAYRGKMSDNEFSKIIANKNYKKNCPQLSGALYEKMSTIALPFEIYNVDWWSEVINEKPDFVGHYDCSNGRFSTCFESRQIKYSYKYKNGYCYLLIERAVLGNEHGAVEVYQPDR